MDNTLSAVMLGDEGMQSNLAGRLDNTHLSLSNSFLPVFECVANSIHAIEERKDISSLTDGKIVVEIERIPQTTLTEEDSTKIPTILSISVTDNGIGFTDDNLKSFQTLDSVFKKEKGCRGVGRILWLKAFDSVEITSMYLKNNYEPNRRHFFFNKEKEVHNVVNEVLKEGFKYQTKIKLSNFLFKDKVNKKTPSIASDMLEHFLWYFIREEGVPHIEIYDNTLDSPIFLNDLYDKYISENITQEKITILEHEFVLFHLSLNGFSSINSVLWYCAEDRAVKKFPLIKNITGFFGKVNVDEKKTGYACMVSSKYLDEHVRADRTGFDIEEESTEFFPDLLSYTTINNVIFERISEFLKDVIEQNKNDSKNRVAKFVEDNAPRYRPIINQIEANFCIDPLASDSEIEMTLHKELYKLEREIIKEGHEILAVPSELNEDYRNRLTKYMSKVKIVKQTDLVAYVAKRRVILDLLEKILTVKPDGSYNDEELLHSLIVPMRRDSDEFYPDEDNLWIIDERMVFHQYLASDKPISAYPTDSSSRKEPDIGIINRNCPDVFGNPIFTAENNDPSSISLVEFKKPMRKDLNREESDPLEQIKNYLINIRKGKCKTRDGRPLMGLEDTPGFCYVICDFTPEYWEKCKMYHELTPSPDNSYLFSYGKNIKAYFEVLPYSTLLRRAKERNQAFFNKLGLPCK